MVDITHLKLHGYNALLADHCELADAVAAQTAVLEDLRERKNYYPHCPPIFFTNSKPCAPASPSWKPSMRRASTRPAQPRRGKRTPGCPGCWSQYCEETP